MRSSALTYWSATTPPPLPPLCTAPRQKELLIAMNASQPQCCRCRAVQSATRPRQPETENWIVVTPGKSLSCRMRSATDVPCTSQVYNQRRVHGRSNPLEIPIMEHGFKTNFRPRVEGERDIRERESYSSIRFCAPLGRLYLLLLHCLFAWSYI